ncbi:hypothetical protein [Candidatus Uabimicrobium sp. HlEnr_7]|uniref:hypothetical protein n=1 Tax=Candidatus Uabimicrobium helgolandensis TaxID=3095367 RepID=UPI0035575B2D
MKYIACLFVCILTLNANVSVETVYSHLNKLSEDENLLLSHRDSASVLSTIWELSRNYTIEDLSNEENSEIDHKQSNGAFGAFIKDQQVFIKTLITTNDKLYCISLSPKYFGPVLISRQDIENAKHIALPQKSQAFNGVTSIVPKIITSKKKQKVIDPINLFQLAGKPILGISAVADGNAKITVNGKVVFKQRMKKGRIYKAPKSLPGSKVVFQCTFSKPLTNQQLIHRGIFEVHFSLAAVKIENSFEFARTSGNTAVFEKEIALTSSSSVEMVKLPNDFDSQESIEIIGGNNNVKITSHIVPNPIIGPQLVLMADSKSTFDIKIQIKLVYNVFEIEEIIQSVRYTGKTIKIDLQGKEFVSGTVEMTDISSNVKEMVLKLRKDFMKSDLVQLIAEKSVIEGSTSQFFVDCDLSIMVKKK